MNNNTPFTYITNNVTDDELFLRPNLTTYADETTDNIWQLKDDSLDKNLLALLNMFVCILLLVGIGYCAKPVTTVARTDTESRRRRLLHIIRRRRRERGEETKPTNRLHTDPDYRNIIIFDSLVVKRIIAFLSSRSDAPSHAENNSHFVLGDISNDEHEFSKAFVNEDEDYNKINDNSLVSAIEANGSPEDEEMCDQVEESCCPICLEPFQLYDEVAWSRYSNKLTTSMITNNTTEVQNDPSPSCLHVFHKDCIVSWLQYNNHDDCPSCRTRILHEEKEAISCHEEDQGEDCSDNESSNNLRTVFVIVHGLISKIATGASFRTSQLNSEKKSLCDYNEFQFQNQTDSKSLQSDPWTLRRVFSLEALSRRRHHFRLFTQHDPDWRIPIDYERLTDDIQFSSRSESIIEQDAETIHGETKPLSIAANYSDVLTHDQLLKLRSPVFRRVTSAGPRTPRQDYLHYDTVIDTNYDSICSLKDGSHRCELSLSTTVDGSDNFNQLDDIDNIEDEDSIIRMV